MTRLLQSERRPPLSTLSGRTRLREKVDADQGSRSGPRRSGAVLLQAAPTSQSSQPQLLIYQSEF